MTTIELLDSRLATVRQIISAVDDGFAAQARNPKTSTTDLLGQAITRVSAEHLLARLSAEYDAARNQVGGAK
jgi:hypothetical protein